MSASPSSSTAYTTGIGHYIGSEASTSDYAPSLRYPTSSCRDEPLPGATSSRPIPVQEPTKSPLLRAEYEKYFDVLKEVTVSSLDPGARVSKDHPLISAFIDKLPTAKAVPAHYRAETYRQRKDFSYLPLERTVHGLLDIKLDGDLSEAVFAQAALELLYQPHHPGHCALWCGHTAVETADRVQRIWDMQPSPIIAYHHWKNVHLELTHLVATHKEIIPAAPGIAAGKASTNNKKRARGLLPERQGVRHSSRLNPASEQEDIQVEVVDEAESRPRKRARVISAATVVASKLPSVPVETATASEPAQVSHEVPVAETEQATHTIDATTAGPSKSASGSPTLVDEDEFSAPKTTKDDIPAPAPVPVTVASAPVRRSLRERKATPKVVAGAEPPQHAKRAIPKPKAPATTAAVAKAPATAAKATRVKTKGTKKAKAKAKSKSKSGKA